MENTTSGLTPRKKTRNLILAGLAVVTVALSLFFIFNKPRKDSDAKAYEKYIEAYTSGTISKKSFIRIQLAGNVKNVITPGKADERSLIRFSPAVSGKVYWVDARTLEFRPEDDLEPGETYHASLQLDELTDTEKGLEAFDFSFKIIKPGFSVENHGLVSQNSSSMDLMKLSGSITTSDTEESAAIEQLLQASAGKKLNIKWKHDLSARQSTFTIDSIKKTASEQQVELSWDGDAIRADQEGETTLALPKLGVFKVLDIRAVQDDEDYALVQFSEPVNVAQDLAGLITLGTFADLRFTIDGSQVKVYASEALEGTHMLQVSTGVENIRNNRVDMTKSASLVFENKLPQAIIAGSGTILPNSGKLILPFDAVNLSAVDVTIIKIYENNIPQFFQANNYKEGNQLRRVARPVVQKTIRLDDDKALNLHKKNRFNLDLDKLLKTEPGAMYRVTIGFRREYNLYKCDAGTQGSEASENEDGEYYSEKIDEDDDFWSRYEAYYPMNYRWDDRDNPCTPSFYTRERFASRNLMASNLGLIAKRGNDNSMLVVATDLLTAEPMSGVELDLVDYQNQVLLKGKTDGDGMASFTLTRRPFLLIARKGDERGYLKLDDGNALPLSRFDVGGDVVQNGVKGYLYGERGVWRPGDSIFVSFILEDKLKKLPARYPVTFELYDARGKLYQKTVAGQSLNGFYTYKTATDNGAPTGNWLLKARAGGSVFSKTIKVETVMPNRLKIDFNTAGRKYLRSGSASAAQLSARWLFGATAQNLRATVDVNLSTAATAFKGFEGYSFDNPTVRFESQVKTIFNGRLNENGSATVNTNLDENTAPGVLKANFTTKVFEPGGNFSLDYFSIPYHVYSSYLGIRSPQGDRLSGMLVTGKDHRMDLVSVNTDGRLQAGNKTVQVELYKVQWRWWWDQDDAYTYANFTQNQFNKIIQKTNVTLINGRGSWNLRLDEPEWGRYLILVRDLEGGHVTGKSVYVDWPGWAQREQANNPTEASMLSFTANKQKFKVGEEVVLTIPTAKAGRALISIENGSRVIKTFWTKTTAGQTQFRFRAEKDMAPNVFANVSLLQPHAQTVNDLPIRMYGAIPLLIEDPGTILKPQLNMPAKIRPETPSSLTVSEQNGKAMTYTIALVDEGLLDLTRFKTPNPHGAFYAREGLGVKTWDLFDYVLGAWGGNLERLLSIGGDGTANRNLNPAKANRFKPVVKFLGPFYLAAGEKKAHKFTLPPYIGAVRAMVVAGQDGAYGFAEKSVQVKKPLMLLATLPRMVGPGEQFTLPVTVFATENNLKNVTVSLAAQKLSVNGKNSQVLYYKQPGEQQCFFNITVPEKTGIARVRVTAQSGGERSFYDVEIDVRNPNPYVTNVQAATLQPGQRWETSFQPIGTAGTNSGAVEVSTIPPLNLGKRLGYLLQYPHGCVEQTTSAVFPQLVLHQLSQLSQQQQAAVQKNVKAGVNKLKAFQTADGGFAYWPNEAAADEWGTNYAAHFLIEAAAAGYELPAGAENGFIKYLRTKAAAWAPNSTNFYGGDLMQAYRLYVLALARKPEMAAMNRLRAFEYLSVSAKWRLAAAYKLAGQGGAATQLIKGLSTDIKPYNQLSGTYGSDLRDQAMILETLTLLGQHGKAGQMLQRVASRLGEDSWYSTQTTAYSLVAIAKFCGQHAGSNQLRYSFTTDGLNGKVDTKNYLNSTALTFKTGKTTLVNTGKRVLFVRLILSGQPAAGQNDFLPNREEVLQAAVSYKLLNGKPVDPANLKQGTDFFAEVSIKNPGGRGLYEQMALTQIFPSGWEIINARLNDNESILASSPANYQDIRDDRVFTYFNIREGETLTYKILLNASYLGRFYLPATLCEAMYDNNISATVPGQWVEVTR
ncbi:hypothetical protein C7T94_09960 [Pedobacter yulinensis]|uniref:Alpha-2-macroglobulin n=1 Tax=Pedobacter yulinensis TaxID=2126353 RepID=A0A2T3HKG2_9SPHI|nr:MG2 domain-containing protein [Pedobacter yulinensis]PST82945.1 hypothetical protein C7T94_09960 [Pedobacter yulinensis]